MSRTEVNTAIVAGRIEGPVFVSRDPKEILSYTVSFTVVANGQQIGVVWFSTGDELNGERPESGSWVYVAGELVNHVGAGSQIKAAKVCVIPPPTCKEQPDV